ncbi:isopentenyl-diphosphate Delta-isomerase [Streptomyces regalis]|uniref:Isopentenyl-diphosphate Delta-isomerase n=1 Tax=Streptomyces regalis TaxID=68262 RepID=A0A101JAK8_9ACTN|nr:isopentenyl-diphosphate Delta-isomerase [Streptomyces regalis]KUL23240.1 isopentenyl-diphosphate delta-isomerase [Streptomyces regalis]
MTNTARDDLIVLVSEDGEEVGVAPKTAAHSTDTPLHLAFSCYLFDEAGRFLLTRRALGKKTWPGVWTNSCCGHPLPGEPLGDSVDRRLHDELGSAAVRMDVVLPVVRYRAVMSNGIVENELGPVLRVLPRLPVVPDPEEIAGVRWVSWEPFVASVLDGSQEISPWSRITVERLASLGPDPWQWPAADDAALPPALRSQA